MCLGWLRIERVERPKVSIKTVHKQGSAGAVVAAIRSYFPPKIPASCQGTKLKGQTVSETVERTQSDFQFMHEVHSAFFHPSQPPPLISHEIKYLIKHRFGVSNIAERSEVSFVISIQARMTN